MNRKLLTVSLILMLPCLSFAQGPENFLCTYGDLQRRVEILYETGMMLPCEVHYYKDTEAPGEKQVLWRAMNEADYCETKTQAFIAKLEDLGWSCGQNQELGSAVEQAVELEPAVGLEPAVEPEPAVELEPATEKDSD